VEGRNMMFTINAARQPFILCICLIFLLAACGASETAQSSWSDGKHIVARSSVATFRHSPEGTLQMVWDKQTRELTVMLTLVGLAPKSVHPAHIHIGSCRHPGKALYELKKVVADDIGLATTTTKIANVRHGIPASGWYVHVHNGPGLTTNDQFTPIACADATHPEGVTRVVSTLGPTIAPNQAVSGEMQLSTDGKKLMTTLSVHGLTPGSKHAVHIHRGSCASQGKVIYTLKPLVANAMGVATETATIDRVSSIPQSGWYVNVHRSTNLSNQTGFDPIACGDITPLRR
jgi:hypothetical protein